MNITNFMKTTVYKKIDPSGHAHMESMLTKEEMEKK